MKIKMIKGALGLFAFIVVLAIIYGLSNIMPNNLNALTSELGIGRGSPMEIIDLCIENGGDVEVRNNGSWSCHLPNEVLKDEQ